MFNFRQKSWIVLALFFFLFAYLANTSTVAYGWLIFGSMLIIVLISDLMFHNEKSYLYDPDYKNWKDKCDTKY